MQLTVFDLLDSISRGSVHSEPFQRLEFTNFFPDSVYNEMVRLFPPAEACRELRHPDAIDPETEKSTRMQFTFSDAEYRKLPSEMVDFWAPFRITITHPDVAEALRHKLCDGMRMGFGDRWDKVKLNAGPALVQDRSGYRISPHPDTPAKALTLQIYLPTDDSQEDLGTVFYRKEANSPPRVARKIKFLPNRGYCFPVTNSSFHGCDPVRADAGSRNSLLVFWYYQ